ncbi:HupE/UreJ family protein, partial [Escherichia coli]|nr:HupE/UreJ family protein [Escherichia coli]
MIFNVNRIGVRSSILAAVVLFVMTLPALAHEVRPAVGDVTVTAESARVDLTVTLEAMVAGIDMAGLSDTNESPLSGYYDRLRALPPQELEQAFAKVWPRVVQGLGFQVDGARIEPELSDLRIPQVGDTALPRDSVLVVTAALPPGDAPVQIGWVASNGPLVLRQMGQGDDLYSGYLTGGALSDPLPREGVAQVGAATEFGRYVVLGFEHILPKGLDHILFVLGLFLFSLQMRP